MSINDPLELVWNPKHEYWYLVRGRETFYDEERYLRTWPTAAGALMWASRELPDDSVRLPSLDAPWPDTEQSERRDNDLVQGN